MRHYPSWIAGLAYTAPDGTDRGAYCASLREGTRLETIPEPTNRFDPKAVALHHNGHHVGYVPERHHWVARALIEGDGIECKVADITLDDAGRAARVGLQIGIASHGSDIDGLEINRGSEFEIGIAAVASEHVARQPVAARKPRRWLLLLIAVPALTLLAFAVGVFVGEAPPVRDVAYVRTEKPTSIVAAPAPAPVAAPPVIVELPMPRPRPRRREN